MSNPNIDFNAVPGLLEMFGGQALPVRPPDDDRLTQVDGAQVMHGARTEAESAQMDAYRRTLKAEEERRANAAERVAVDAEMGPQRALLQAQRSAAWARLVQWLLWPVGVGSVIGLLLGIVERWWRR